ncbi:ABC transporter permease [Streptomyces sp. NPDC050617]|uniref:ABC transporter permease n=1 Tax=Streptomyces sp. NPDC050617 TaxID=3154628 RepID=UPI0034390DFC
MGFAFQLRMIRRSPDTALVCVTAPLYTLILLAITEHGGRGDLAAYGVVAPTLMALWTMALNLAGQIITEERILGTLEGLVAAPASLWVLVISRLSAVTVVGLVAFAEAWLVAGAAFGRWIVPAHGAVFLITLSAAGLATAGTASVLSTLFVLAPNARTIQNTLTYPFYLLGGVMVPVSHLPAWLRPASAVVFLSWAADLLRDSLLDPPVHHVALRLLTLAVLGAAGAAIGAVLLKQVLRHVRMLGTLART